MKPRSWSSQVIHYFQVMQSISMDLKVMPTSFRGYNYLLVMRCNHSCYIIIDTLKTTIASEVAESIFQKLICTHGTNIKEIYCDPWHCLQKWNCVNSVQVIRYHSKILKCPISPKQSVSQILIHYITRYGNLWCIMANMASFCLNIFPIGHLQNLSSYEILFGRNPPAISNLQLEADEHRD